MNKSQAEKKVYAFHAVFRVDVNDVNPFQNPTETSPFDHFLDPQSRPKIVNEYDQEIPQSQTTDNPVAPRERAAQPSRDTRRTN